MGLSEVIRRGIESGELGPAAISKLCEALVQRGDRDALLEELTRCGVLSADDRSQTGSQMSQTGTPSTQQGLSRTDTAGAWDHDVNRGAPRVDAAVAVGPPPPPGKPVQGRSSDKYEIKDELARGGVGVIHVAHDRGLMRTLVMKTLIESAKVSDYVLKKFVEEAQITAQLEHPNIVPVHDFGRLDDGSVYFTMKLIQGRTLKDILRKIRKEDPEVSEAFSRLRLLGIFQQVCNAIGFGHSRGVIHRDIKPSNVMIGEYGETLVLDWGVAKVLGAEEDDPGEHVSTVRSESDDATMMGIITGTPAYMPPEQAAGKIDRIDPRSDVYSLGALLYEILVGRPPFRGRNPREILKAVILQPPRRPSERAPERNIPARLEEICLKCLEKRPRDRYQSVPEIVADIEQYLANVEDFDRRVRMADKKFREGLDRVQEFAQSRDRVESVRDAVMDLEWHTSGYAALTEKRVLWAKQADLAEQEMQMHQAFSAAARALVAAIGFDPSHAEASNELARLYWFKLREAEANNDEGTAIYYRDLVAAYDRGIFEQQLRGEGRLVLRSTPAGAQVSASPYMEVDLKLSTLMDEALGSTPLNNIPLREGSWLLTLSADGYRDVRLPVKIRRGEVLDISAPMFTDAQIGPHFLYVPGGNFVLGGDSTCASARHRRPTQVDGFFMGRYPVTCGEYLAFVRELDQHDPNAALARVPRLKASAGHLWTRTATGILDLPALDSEGFSWEPHWPVFGISFEDAQAYCDWYTRRSGVAVRLPTEAEWEKAGRGLDGRLYPWGMRFDASFCKMSSSRIGRPVPERVGCFPADCSPYAIFDLAGLVSEYCNSPFDADDALRVVKGGNYESSGELACRLTHRRSTPRNTPNLHHGFRLVRDLPVEAAEKGARRMVRPRFE